MGVAVENAHGLSTAIHLQLKREPSLVKKIRAHMGGTLGLVDLVEHRGEGPWEFDGGHQARDQTSQPAGEGQLFSKEHTRGGLFEAGLHGLKQNQDQRACHQSVRQEETTSIADPQKQQAVHNGEDQGERSKDQHLAQQLVQVEQARRQNRLG